MNTVSIVKKLIYKQYSNLKAQKHLVSTILSLNIPINFILIKKVCIDSYFLETLNNLVL